MAGPLVRDPVGDHLLTPQNAALMVIDYQPSQFAAVGPLDAGAVRRSEVVAERVPDRSAGHQGCTWDP